MEPFPDRVIEVAKPAPLHRGLKLATILHPLLWVHLHRRKARPVTQGIETFRSASALSVNDRDVAVEGRKARPVTQGIETLEGSGQSVGVPTESQSPPRYTGD